MLLECQGGNINLKTIGFTPVMIAATNNEDDIVQFLCEYSGTPRLDLDLKVKLAAYSNEATSFHRNEFRRFYFCILFHLFWVCKEI